MTKRAGKSLTTPIQPHPLKFALERNINHHDYSQFIKMGGGAKVPYPKHVWSPAGGWYTQPKNWKVNTAVMLAAIFGVTAMSWKYSAENEYRTKFPEQGRFYPSRYWSKQIIEHEKEVKEGKKSA
ncbi:hypothetical protein V499_08107 [Pseudogymnoascus sp. VKM F-103]|uniref:Uncharacterized protein n=1 Tax=Pseudogymnoascus verrucosus TaxID=342668 RepID=A0A1B8G7A2_9PEZI|nr:uncharacterized protein VE01_10259 [Pseudogymnoascus verrucosus]KFY71705.1 hypothetical protein V499_08107 [Pseudogymnoascus sp. VKM F-103]OBT91707.1 hypothetical protein VE01_10259 [Pseudogymnoascus verrucosus]